MPLPDITHLQFQILAILIGPEKAGREVRAQLKKEGIKKDGPAFYMLMSRLEDARLVKSRPDVVVVGGKRVTIKQYKITAKGVSAYNTTLDFYQRRAAEGLTGRAGEVGA